MKTRWKGCWRVGSGVGDSGVSGLTSASLSEVTALAASWQRTGGSCGQGSLRECTQRKSLDSVSNPREATVLWGRYRRPRGQNMGVNWNRTGPQAAVAWRSARQAASPQRAHAEQ